MVYSHSQGNLHATTSINFIIISVLYIIYYVTKIVYHNKIVLLYTLHFIYAWLHKRYDTFNNIVKSTANSDYRIQYHTAIFGFV